MTKPLSSSVNEGRGRALNVPLTEMLLVLVLLVAYATVSSGVDTVVLWGCLALQYFLLVSAFLRPVTIVSKIPSYVTSEFLFLFFSYFIFFYPYQLHVLGIYPISQSAFFHNTFIDYSNHAIILSAVGVVSFRAGIRCLNPRPVSDDIRNRRMTRLDFVSVKSLAPPICALQLLSIATYSAFGWRAAGEGRYSGQIVGGPLVEGVYLVIIVLAMISLGLWFLPEEGGKRPVALWLSTMVSIFWSVRLLLNGDRNSFMLIAIVAVAGYLTFRVRAGRWALVILCVVAIVMYNAVEALRSGQINSLADAIFSGWGATDTTYGGDTSFNISTISVRAALAGVPDQIDYGYGLYKLIGVAGIFPFIRGMLIPPGMHFVQSSDVLSEILLGSWARWGVGSNIIVDIYVDFGVIAVPALLFGLGAFVAYMQYAVARLPSSPWRVTMYLMTLALVAEIPRYSLDFPVRPLAWTLLLFWAVALTTSRRPGRQPTGNRKPHEQPSGHGSVRTPAHGRD